MPVIIETANGSVTAQRGNIQRLANGPLETEDLGVVVSESFGDLDVIGMNFCRGCTAGASKPHADPPSPRPMRATRVATRRPTPWTQNPSAAARSATTTPERLTAALARGCLGFSDPSLAQTTAQPGGPRRVANNKLAGRHSESRGKRNVYLLEKALPAKA